MGFGWARASLVGAVGASLALCVGVSLCAQATGAAANRQRSAVSVPFVGCVLYGQSEKLDAPKGKPRSLAISPKEAESLAYYKSAYGPGVLGPRDWYCEGASGSDGSVLFLSPEPIDRNAPGFAGSAIELRHISGENSGRYEITEIMARVFPEYRAFASRVWEGLDVPLPSGPFPNGTLTYRSKTVVEYNTPAQADGLGTHFSWLKKNDSPVTGVAIISGEEHGVNPPYLLLLSVRLPPHLARLTPAIVRYVERDAIGATGK